MQHRGSSIPGREIVQVLTEIPCGVESGWHIHPGEEVGYIVAGTVRDDDRRRTDAARFTPATASSSRRALRTTRSTSVPTPGGCSPPTSSRSANRSPRSSTPRPTDFRMTCHHPYKELSCPRPTPTSDPADRRSRARRLRRRLRLERRGRASSRPTACRCRARESAPRDLHRLRVHRQRARADPRARSSPSVTRTAVR